MESPSEKALTCRKCEVAWGLIGAAFALAIFYISADLLSGGALTKLITGGPIAPVIPLRSADDDAG